jgi:hypothetical protein
VKITSVAANNRKRAFEVRTRQGNYLMPYLMLDPRPTARDKVRKVGADREFGNEAFTYVLESGLEGSVHLDSVLAYNDDPGYAADLLLYDLSLEAGRRFESSPFSVREVARRLGTSQAQLYRLLDPKNTTKSLRQMLALLHVLGCAVEVRVKPRSSKKTV